MKWRPRLKTGPLRQAASGINVLYVQKPKVDRRIGRTGFLSPLEWDRLQRLCSTRGHQFQMSATSRLQCLVEYRHVCYHHSRISDLDGLGYSRGDNTTTGVGLMMVIAKRDVNPPQLWALPGGLHSSSVGSMCGESELDSDGSGVSLECQRL